jgi:hypothetical protein
MDNVSFHHHEFVKNVIRDLRLPVHWTAAGSFESLPVEEVFNRIKKKFNLIHQDKHERMERERQGSTRG